MKTNNDKDYLEGLFRQLPQEPLPADFRIRIMQQITEEAERIRKRNERWSWVALIAASLFILGLGVSAFVYIGVPEISLSVSLQALKTIPFYLYIAFLGFLLLCADHLFRKRYREKHND